MMSERLRPSAREIGAWWAAALGFWLFVIAICVVQVAWMSRTGPIR